MGMAKDDLESVEPLISGTSRNSALVVSWSGPRFKNRRKAHTDLYRRGKAADLGRQVLTMMFFIGMSLSQGKEV
jgi:hypothetical protein